jgi:competence protein ComEC
VSALARVPLVPLAAAFAGGVAAAPAATPLAVWGLWALAWVTGVALLVGARPTAATVATLLAVAALGALGAMPLPAPGDDVSRLSVPRTARVEGRLADEPTRWTPERARLLLDVDRIDGEPRSGRVQLTAYGPLLALAEGQRVSLDARLDRPVGFRNPGTFDHAAYLRRRGIAVTGTVRGPQVHPLDGDGPPWHTQVRRRAVAAMQDTLPPTSAALLAGLLLGERGTLPPDVDAAFRRAGVSHVLAVSGFNVALVAATVWVLLMLARAPRRVAGAGAMVVVVGYAAVAGPEPSVLRATLMAVLVLAALLLDREAAVLNSLALAAVLILAFRPADAHDPGFQLSFAATAGIVLAPMPRHWLLAALAVSAAAQAAVLPISLVHFNQVSIIGVVANLAVVPLAGLATVLGLFAVATEYVGTAPAAWLFAGTWPVLLLLRWVVAAAAAVPGAVVYLPAPGTVAVVCYATALGAGLTAWHVRASHDRACRRLGALAVALLITSALATFAPVMRPPDGRLRLSVLDVGQGDAIVVEGPDGRVVLVDAGAGGPYRLDAGERVVAPFLWNRGVLRLTAAVVTHDDADHAGGMPAVRRLFTVRQPWDGSLAAGPLGLGGAVLTPLPATEAGGRNDTGRVLRLDFGLASILLASDLEGTGERALVASRAALAATALKVSHHGSRTSSTPEFLAAVHPTVALVSVGARNPYQHPDPAVLSRLTSIKADIHRTDHHGALLLETNGRTLTVTRWATKETLRYCLDPDTPC